VSVFQQIEQYFSLHYVGTLITAAFGASVGAWATTRRETKRAIVAELNSVRAARMLTFSVCNRCIAIKRQHIRPIYQDHAAAYEKYQEDRRGGEREPGIKADLRSLTPVHLPMQALERQLFEKISIGGRAIAAAAELIGIVEGLNAAIRTRNELVAELKQLSPLSPGVLAERYFGLRTDASVRDERIPSNIAALYAQTDDCIFFSRILADDLMQYGERLRRRYAWRFRLNIPKAEPANWTFAEEEGLLPKQADYVNWLRGFPGKKPAAVRRMLRILFRR
jgi:hypothetical protein